MIDEVVPDTDETVLLSPSAAEGESAPDKGRRGGSRGRIAAWSAAAVAALTVAGVAVAAGSVTHAPGQPDAGGSPLPQSVSSLDFSGPTGAAKSAAPSGSPSAAPSGSPSGSASASQSPSATKSTGATPTKGGAGAPGPVPGQSSAAPPPAGGGGNPPPPAASGGSFEAESGALTGRAAVISCPSCSGGSRVGYLGTKAGYPTSTLTFTNVTVSTSGTYQVVVAYTNGADTRQAEISVNGGAVQTVSFPSTGAFTTSGTVTVALALNAGSNSITFGNGSSVAPDLDKITVPGSPS
jgi:hypothetical protein